MVTRLYFQLPELYSPTAKRLAEFADSKVHNVVTRSRADAGSTKNKRTARQYIQPELALELQSPVGTKLRGALVFHLPHVYTMPDMLRKDLEAARQDWLDTKKDPQARLEADASDFLQSVDSDNERIDVHSLHHTCATWLIHTGGRCEDDSVGDEARGYQIDAGQVRALVSGFRG